MRIEQADLADAERTRLCYEVDLAAQRVDEPERTWFTDRPFRGWLAVGWGGNPREVWLATEEGSAAGWYRLELPDRENRDQANLVLVVHPAERRHGLGLALLRHAASRAAAHGRSVLSGDARDGSPGEAFARSVGAKPGLVDIQRVLEPGKLEQGEARPATRASRAGRLRLLAGVLDRPGARGVHRAGGGAFTPRSSDASPRS